MEFERRPVELRAEAGKRQITGTVMRYGEQATVLAPGGRVVKETVRGRERSRSTWQEFRTALNMMHDGTVHPGSRPGRADRGGLLELFDTSRTELRMVA